VEIEGYDFGWIKIDGRQYDNDVIVVEGRVMANWWRQEGHKLKLSDLSVILESPPEVLVVGTGKSGLMTVPAKVREQLEARGMEVEVYDTAAACKRLNGLSGAGRKAAGALHLTC